MSAIGNHSRLTSPWSKRSRQRDFLGCQLKSTDRYRGLLYKSSRIGEPEGFLEIQNPLNGVVWTSRGSRHYIAGLDPEENLYVISQADTAGAKRGGTTVSKLYVLNRKMSVIKTAVLDDHRGEVENEIWARPLELNTEAWDIKVGPDGLLYYFADLVEDGSDRRLIVRFRPE
jgi:hypothetical protein